MNRVWRDLDVSTEERQGAVTAALLLAGIVFLLIVVAFVTGPVR